MARHLMYGLLKNLFLFLLFLTTVTMQMDTTTKERRMEPKIMIPTVTYLFNLDSDLGIIIVELTGAATSPKRYKTFE